MNFIYLLDRAMATRQTTLYKPGCERDSRSLLHANQESTVASLPNLINQTCISHPSKNLSSMNESQIERDEIVLDSSSADESVDDDDDDEITDSSGLSRSPMALKFDSYKVTIIENSLRLRFEKVSSYNRFDLINQKNVKLRRNICKSFLAKQETAEDESNLELVTLVETVSDEYIKE